MTLQNAPAASLLHRITRTTVCAVLLGSVTLSGQAHAQKTSPNAQQPVAGQTPPGTTSAPVVDSAPLGPTTPPPSAPVTDSAAQASPTMPPAHGATLTANTKVSIRLGQAADSAHVRNGDMLKATLAAPIHLSHGGSLPVGTRIGLTVISVAAAGKLQSRGEMTLQLIHVGSLAVFSDAVTFHGKSGHKDLPDSAPAKGTEASLTLGQILHFNIPPLPR